MSKIINCSIDLKMIDKSKIKIHANGSHYWNFSVMEMKETDQYGKTHYVVEQQTQDERAAKAPKNYLKSSGKAFDFGAQNAQVASNDAAAQEEDDDLPF